MLYYLNMNHPTPIITIFMILALLILAAHSEHKNTITGSPPTNSTSNITFAQLLSGVQYRVKLKIQEQVYLRFDKKQLQGNLVLDISATGTYELCSLNAKNQCSTTPQKLDKKEHEISLTSQLLTYGVKIINSCTLHRIKLKLKYHAKDEQCHQLSPQVLYRRKLFQSNCFQFDLSKEKDAQLLISRQSFINAQFEFILCHQKLLVDANDIKGAKYELPFSVVSSTCLKNPKILVINITNTLSNNTAVDNLFISLVLQYPTESVLLPDGIAYTTTFGQNSEERKLFQYQLINKQSTTISVISKSSMQIYAKIVPQNEKDIALPSKQNCDFSSESGYLFTYFRPYIIITKQQLNKFACTDCFLIVSLLVDYDEGDNTLTIQITQQLSTLINGEMKHHFLQAKSMAYYSYTPKSQVSVDYQLSDNNLNCALFFISKDELPGPQNYDTKSLKNKISCNSEPTQTYYVGVQALKDCAYSLVATEASKDMVILQKGRFGFLNMEKDEVKYFLVQADTTEYIKLLSLHLYGKVQIYLNKTDKESIRKFNKSNAKYSDFAMRGQYMNRLILTKKDVLFCTNCYYLIAVVAQKLTQSTLFFGDQKTPIPISDKVVNDMILQKGGKVKGQYHGNSKFELQVKVHSGKLKFSINKGNHNFSAEYQESSQIKTTTVDLGKTKSFFMLLASVFNYETNKVEFVAMDDNTIYSIRFKQIKEVETILPSTLLPLALPEPPSSLPKIPQTLTPNTNEKQELKMIQKRLDPGSSQYFYVYPKQTTCISGYFRDSSQKILFSCDYDQKHALQNLTITLTANKKSLQYSLQIIRNIMTLSVPSLVNYYVSKGIQYTLCINTSRTESLWLSLMQSEDFSLLPPQVDTLVKGEFTFVTHSQSAIIVDIFECKGESNVIFDSDRKRLDQNTTFSLDKIGLPNQLHAIRVNRFNTTFYKITGALAIVRWFPFSIDRGTGTGYLDYEIGQIRYESGIFGIKLVWQSLSNIKSNNKSISNITYTLYISENYQDLKSDSQCQTFFNNKTMQIFNIVDANSIQQLNTTFSYSLTKGDLAKHFGEGTTLYSTIVIDLALASSQEEGEDEKYRFIYPYIQIPGQIIVSSYIATIVTLDYSQLIAAILLTIAALFIFTYLLSRKILPMLGLLKNRFLVEENEQQVSEPIQNIIGSQARKDDLEIIPPSSQRQGVFKTYEVMDKNGQMQVK